MSNRGVWLVGILLSAASLWGVNFFADGEKALAENHLDKAQTYLEAALAQGQISEKLYLDLGLVYQKLGLVGEALKMFHKGADLGGPLQYLLEYDAGAVSFAQKDWSSAEQAYTAVLQLRPQFADAVLNRANTRLEEKNWQGAIADYELYQSLAPQNPQKAVIDQVIALLKQTLVDAEAQKLAQEVRQKQEAQAKAADEAKQAAAKAQAEALAAAEKKRQEEILQKIRQSLKGVSGDSKALGTGPAGVKTDDGDFSLSP